MRSKEYWEGRFIELQRSQLKRADSFAHELEDLHARMKKEIDDDITVWHKKVATANGISMADAKKLMSRKDRKEFQWTLEEYEQHAKADLLSGVTSANVMNASANWHLSYLDGMKLQLEHHVDKLYKNIDSKTRNHFKETLNENYLNTAFELQKGIGIGEKMEVPYDERKLENILRTPWASDGKNFSNRIWRDRTQLVNNLQKNLSESVIRGDSDTDMIQALSKDEKRAEFNTRRLVETESAYFDSLSEQECCEDFGVEKYRFLAVLDMKTSDICQELDNKVFLEKDRQVGVNAPPMHPFCRSTTAPVIDEEFLTSRRAKNPKTGEYDEIPPEMNYKQWKEKYVEGKENVEEVKQEQVKTETPNGNSTNNSSSKQNQTIEEFDSKEFRKNYDNRVNNKSAVQEPATIEINNTVSYGNTEKVNGAVKLQEKQEEQLVIKLKKQLNDVLDSLEDLKNSDFVKDFSNYDLDELFKQCENSYKGIVRKKENNIIESITTIDKTCKVKIDYFNNQSFQKDCLNIIPTNEKLCLGIYEQCKAIISRRKPEGDSKEEIHMVDVDGGEIGIAEIDEKKLLEHKACFTESQEKTAEEYKKEKKPYYVIHNHPDNSFPTQNDFNHIYDNEYIFGIIICHNGTIYKYYKPHRMMTDLDWEEINSDIKYAKKIHKNKSEEDIVKDVYSRYNFKFERISKKNEHK